MKKQFALLLLFIYLFSASNALAVRQLSITSDKSELALEEEMIVIASVSGFTTGEKVYLKGAFYKEGSTNYFGYTRFNDSWINNSETALSQMETVFGSWNNQVVVKLDYDDTGFTGIGDYKFKLGFYYLTSSGNLTSINWSSNSIPISINILPSPTPATEVTKSVTESPKASTTTSVSNTPIPKLIQTSIKPSITPSVSVKISDARREASSYAQIKSITDAEQEEQKNDEIQVLGSNERSMPSIFLIAGVLLFATSLFMILKRELKRRNIL